MSVTTDTGPDQGATPQILAGRVIVITRPKSQAGPLAAAIRTLGGEAVLFPTIEIREAANPAPFANALTRLATYTWAFFVSPNAVQRVFSRMPSWPSVVRAVAIGPGTKAALEARGVQRIVMHPTQFDSEGLLDLPEFAAMSGARCVIFRGSGGRELIAATLLARGALVDVVDCYQRAIPALDAKPLLARWQLGEKQGGIHAITLTSSEGVRNFVMMVGPEAREFYGVTPAFVPHVRIGEAARALGFNEIIETGAADAGLIAAITAHFGGN